MNRITHQVIVAAAITLLGIVAPAFGQDAAADAEARKKIAEADRDTAIAERDRLKARLGEISTDKLPKGEAKAETLVIEGTILGYRAAAGAAKDIAKTVQKAEAKKVVFFSAKEIASFSGLRAFQTQADVLTRRIGTLVKPPPLVSGSLPPDCKPDVSAALTPPLLVVDAALQLLSLVKVDRSATGTGFTLDEFAVYALVAEELQALKISAAYPPLYHPYALRSPVTKSQAEQTFQGLVNQQVNLESASVMLETLKAQVTKKLEAEKRAACKPLFQADLNTIEERLVQTKTTQKLLDQFVAAALKADDQSGMTLLQALNNAEQLVKDFDSAHLLQVKPIAAGGTTHTKTNLFGSRIFFSGGVVIAYMLADSTGTLKAAGAIPLYEGFVKADDMTEYAGRKGQTRQR